jgi:hypothetical protein
MTWPGARSGMDHGLIPVPDILSQGGDREPSPWLGRVAVAAVVLLVAVVIVWHLPRSRHVTARPAGAAITVAPALPGLATEPSGITGRALPWAGRLRLPAAGQRPAWFWPATGQVKPIGGLPPQRSGYQFTRTVGGWAVQAGPGAGPGCGSCAGPQRPVYFLADRAQAVTWVGMADAVAPGPTAGALWLTSYPPGADVRTISGTAREVSIAGRPLGPPLRLPAGYLIDRAAGRGLLLAPVVQQQATVADRLWNPAAPQASRMFDGVIAASAREIAWAATCASRCRVSVLDLATGRHASAVLPPGSSVANAAFSPDGDFLALQVTVSNNSGDGDLAIQLDLLSTVTGRLTVVPRSWVSSDALVSFGWPASSDSLVAELSFTTKMQLAAWRPGASRLAIAVIRPGRSPASLVIGQYGP